MTKKTPRSDIYQTVTSRIIAELEEGRVPWVQPWGRDAAASAALPKNAISERAYSGVNILILWGEAIAHHYPSQVWMTFRQAKNLGGSVRKGEHGAQIVYADRFTPKAERERAAESGDAPKTIPFLKAFTVFNVAQCDGLPDSVTAAPAPLPECGAIPRAESLIASTGADIRIGGDKACYNPSADYISLPPQPTFFEQINYYRTAFHELGHWTGHESRLDRTFHGRYGSRPYAREELVAEMTSAFVCASLAISPTVRHADYIGSWLALLKDDKKAIFNAASLASKASDFLLSHRPDQALRAA